MDELTPPCEKCGRPSVRIWDYYISLNMGQKFERVHSCCYAHALELMSVYSHNANAYFYAVIPLAIHRGNLVTRIYTWFFRR